MGHPVYIYTYIMNRSVKITNFTLFFNYFFSNVQGLCGVLRSADKPDKEFEIFVDMRKMYKFSEFIKECYQCITEPVLLLGSPDSSKQWEDFITTYLKAISKDLPRVRTAENIGINIG